MRQRGGADPGPQPLGKLETCRLACFRQQHRKFLAAETIGAAGVGHRIDDDLRDILHDDVAGIVAELIVEALEMVDIDHQAGEWLAALPARLTVQRLVEAAPVEQARQRVAHRQIGELLAQLKIGDGQPDVFGDQFEIEARCFDCECFVRALLEIEETNGIALGCQRHAETDRAIVVEMLAGDVAVTAIADMRPAAAKSPAGAGREGWRRMLRIEPTADAGQERPAVVQHVEMAGKIGKDLRRKAGHDLRQFVLALAGLQPVHHLQDKVLGLLIQAPLRIEPITLDTVFPKDVDRLVHLADLVAAPVERDLHSVVLLGETRDDAAHAGERHGDAALENEIEHAQEQGGGDAKHRLGRDGEPVAARLCLVERPACASIGQVSKPCDRVEKRCLQALVLRAE
ncbi:hypothetical protein D9M68_492780 [compost metagenome]